MISVQDAVTQIVDSDSFIENLMADELINLNAYARKIHSQVEDLCLKQVKVNTIVVALQRLNHTLPDFPPIFDTNSYIELYDTISRLKFDKLLFKKHAGKIIKRLQHERYFNVVYGKNQAIIFCPPEAIYKLPSAVLYDETSITHGFGIAKIKSSPTAISTPSVIYQLTKALHYVQINIIEIITIFEEIDLVLKSDDLMKAGDSLQKVVNFYKT